MPSQRQLFLQHLAPTSAFPLLLEVANAEGVYLVDSQGKKHLDLISGIGVSCLGHCHPAVVAAVQKQAATFMHTMVYGEYVLAPQVELAELLAAQLPDSLDSIYFVNSGTEAVEGALKLAKRHTNRSRIISCHNAYHGSTMGAMSLMSDPTFTAAFRPLLPDVHHIEFNEEEELKKIDEQVAAVIVEPVQGEWGVRPANPGYLTKLRKRCSEVGAILIFDEIQSGFGRTGHLFAFQKEVVVPDVLLMAKGMGGGMPIGAFMANRQLMECLSHDPILGHITTFGGHPVSCAAALATLQTLLASKLIDEVEAKSQYLLENLQHSLIIEKRAAGLMMAVELDSFDRVQKVISYCLANGLITDWFLFNDRSIRIAPPLIISYEELDFAIATLVTGLNEAM